MSHPGPANGGSNPPPNQLAIWSVLGAAVVLVASLFGVRLEHQPETTRDYPRRELIADAAPVLMQAPEIDDEYLPCSDCHDDELPTNAEVRELEDEHDDKLLVHGDIWCLHCHDPEDREQLRLADGTRVAMQESWRLCTQCHGNKLPDWRAGVHGKRTGHWRGEKEYRTCVVCHEPHAPAFQPLKPEPPPRRPSEIVRGGKDAIKGGEHGEDS